MVIHRNELVVKVEGAGCLVQRANDDADGSDLRRGSPTPMQSIHQKVSSELPPAIGTADSEPAEEGDRDQRIPGKSLANRFRKRGQTDTVSRQRVVSEDRTMGVDQDEWCGNLRLQVLTGLAM